MWMRARVNKLAGFLLKQLDRIVLPVDFSQKAIKYLAVESYVDLWNVRPMNGQKNRIRTCYYLARILKPTHAIETGTYIGTTTQYLTSMVSKKTFSIEINEKFLLTTSTRLKREFESGTLELISGDSKVEIKRILEGLDPTEDRVLAYLDAHWLDYIPLREEIQCLLDWQGIFMAVIDDFKVPWDAGYGYDKYGEHKIDVSCIPISEKFTVWLPSEPAKNESGAVRGTAYLIHNDLSPQIYSNIDELKISPFI